jgi:hypothetical protein
VNNSGERLQARDSGRSALVLPTATYLLHLSGVDVVPPSCATVTPPPTAGAINFGKTNLDQFASGLVGTRTPYGVATNAFDSRFIPGGSSSGSAAAVGGGLLSFALGTDTAGSGRVPAMYNGCVGLKGSLGKISTVGELCAPAFFFGLSFNVGRPCSYMHVLWQQWQQQQPQYR